MASGQTTRGVHRMLGVTYRNVAIPGGAFAVFLATSAVTPDQDTVLRSELTEIAAGNGYTAGGINVARDATDWDVHTEDTLNDRSFIQIKDLTWTASTGPLPASGGGARWAILTDQNATPGDREALAWFDLAADRAVSDGQDLVLQDCELGLSTV